MNTSHMQGVLPFALPWYACWLLVGLIGLHPVAASELRFDASKPTLHVGTISHVDHGRATLTAAITKVLAEDGFPTTAIAPRLLRMTGPMPPNGVPYVGERTVTISTSHVEYETASRSYLHVDPLEDSDYVKNMITGVAQVDGAILVVSAPDGPMPQTREHVLLARQVGLPALVVFLDKADLDGERTDQVEMEIRSLLESGYPGAPIIRGNAERALEGDVWATAQVRELLRVMDTTFPLPAAEIDRPFLMPIEDVFFAAGRGRVIEGAVERGVIRAGDEVEIVGARPTASAIVTATALRKDTRGRTAHELALQGVDGPLFPEKGQVLCKPGSIAPYAKFRARVYFLSEEEGGRRNPFFSNYRPQFYFRTTDVKGRLDLPEGVDLVLPGDNSPASIELFELRALEPGTRFAIRQGGITVGMGVVVEVAE